MQKIVPFKTHTEALATLDNGGRFYNLFTKAGDDIVTAAEVGKVAGVYSDKQKMTIYLALCLGEMHPVSAEQVIYTLTDDLKEALQRYLPKVYTATQAKENGTVGSSAIVTGIPKLVESKSDFNGFIIVPVSTGKSMTMILIPIIDKYDIYEIRDEASSETFFIAHARGEEKLPEHQIKAGGIIKELTTKKDGVESKSKFLETLYYVDNELIS
jgi:hypothetical protein